MIHPQNPHQKTDQSITNIINTQSNPQLRVPSQNSVTAQIQEAKKQPKKICSSRLKMILIVLFILAAVAATVVGVLFTMKSKTKIHPTRPLTSLVFPEGSIMAMGEYELVVDNLLSPDISVPMTITAVQTPTSRRMLQEVANAQYTVHLEFQEMGIIASLHQNQTMSVEIDLDSYKQYALTQQSSTRLLQDSQIQISSTIEQIQTQITNIFNEQFKTQTSTDFKEIENIHLDLNVETGTFELKTYETKARRMLTVRQLRKIKFPSKPLQQAVSQVVKPAVQVVRKSGPQIGAVAGGIVGGVAGAPGGPGGVVYGVAAGAKTGYQLGMAAQVAVQACVPQNSASIRCKKSAIQSSLITTAKNQAINSACPTCPQVKNTINSLPVKINI